MKRKLKITDISMSIFIPASIRNTGQSSKILTICQPYIIKHVRINKEGKPFHLLTSYYYYYYYFFLPEVRVIPQDFKKLGITIIIIIIFIIIMKLSFIARLKKIMLHKSALRQDVSS